MRLLPYIGELKVYFTRIWSYVSILNFIMIFLVFLSTTVYTGWMEKMFPDKQLFLTIGLLLIIIFSLLLGYADKKLGVHAEEISKQLVLKRNPTIAYEVIKVAYAVDQAEKHNPNNPEVKWMKEFAVDNFDRLGMKDYFKRCLKAFEGGAK